jgi:hypothetical protein
MLRACLRASCLQDPAHPRDQVTSVYFDTIGLQHLGEKVNSDYLKTKVRLRWYGEVRDADPDLQVEGFIETKNKVGVRGEKTRQSVTVPARDLLVASNGCAGIQQVFETAGGGATDGSLGRLFPMIAIGFQRDRFVEPISGSRISLDTRIGFTWVNPAFFPPSGPRTHRQGVLEVKNQTGALPETFSGIRHRLNKRDSFSKYEECWQLYADPFYRRDFQWMRFKR